MTDQITEQCSRCGRPEAPNCCLKPPQRVVTAETVTDEEIEDLRRAAERMISDRWPNEEASRLLLASSAALARNLDQSDGAGTWTKWRAECADAINARKAVR